MQPEQKYFQFPDLEQRKFLSVVKSRQELQQKVFIMTRYDHFIDHEISYEIKQGDERSQKLYDRKLTVFFTCCDETFPRPVLEFYRFNKSKPFQLLQQSTFMHKHTQKLKQSLQKFVHQNKSSEKEEQLAKNQEKQNLLSEKNMQEIQKVDFNQNPNQSRQQFQQQMIDKSFQERQSQENQSFSNHQDLRQKVFEFPNSLQFQRLKLLLSRKSISSKLNCFIGLRQFRDKKIQCDRKFEEQRDFEGKKVYILTYEFKCCTGIDNHRPFLRFIQVKKDIFELQDYSLWHDHRNMEEKKIIRNQINEIKQFLNDSVSESIENLLPNPITHRLTMNTSLLNKWEQSSQMNRHPEIGRNKQSSQNEQFSKDKQSCLLGLQSLLKYTKSPKKQVRRQQQKHILNTIENNEIIPQKQEVVKKRKKTFRGNRQLRGILYRSLYHNKNMTLDQMLLQKKAQQQNQLSQGSDEQQQSGSSKSQKSQSNKSIDQQNQSQIQPQQQQVEQNLQKSNRSSLIKIKHILSNRQYETMQRPKGAIQTNKYLFAFPDNEQISRIRPLNSNTLRSTIRNFLVHNPQKNQGISYHSKVQTQRGKNGRKVYNLMFYFDCCKGYQNKKPYIHFTSQNNSIFYLKSVNQWHYHPKQQKIQQMNKIVHKNYTSNKNKIQNKQEISHQNTYHQRVMKISKTDPQIYQFPSNQYLKKINTASRIHISSSIWKLVNRKFKNKGIKYYQQSTQQKKGDFINFKIQFDCCKGFQGKAPFILFRGKKNQEFFIVSQNRWHDHRIAVKDKETLIKQKPQVSQEQNVSQQEQNQNSEQNNQSLKKFKGKTKIIGKTRQIKKRTTQQNKKKQNQQKKMSTKNSINIQAYQTSIKNPLVFAFPQKNQLKRFKQKTQKNLRSVISQLAKRYEKKGIKYTANKQQIENKKGTKNDHMFVKFNCCNGFRNQKPMLHLIRQNTNLRYYLVGINKWHDHRKEADKMRQIKEINQKNIQEKGRQKQKQKGKYLKQKKLIKSLKTKFISKIALNKSNKKVIRTNIKAPAEKKLEEKKVLSEEQQNSQQSQFQNNSDSSSSSNEPDIKQNLAQQKRQVHPIVNFQKVQLKTSQNKQFSMLNWLANNNKNSNQSSSRNKSNQQNIQVQQQQTSNKGQIYHILQQYNQTLSKLLTQKRCTNYNNENEFVNEIKQSFFQIFSSSQINNNDVNIRDQQLWKQCIQRMLEYNHVDILEMIGNKNKSSCQKEKENKFMFQDIIFLRKSQPQTFNKINNNKKSNIINIHQHEIYLAVYPIKYYPNNEPLKLFLAYTLTEQSLPQLLWFHIYKEDSSQKNVQAFFEEDEDGQHDKIYQVFKQAIKHFKLKKVDFIFTTLDYQMLLAIDKICKTKSTPKQQRFFTSTMHFSCIDALLKTQGFSQNSELGNEIRVRLRSSPNFINIKTSWNALKKYFNDVKSQDQFVMNNPRQVYDHYRTFAEPFQNNNINNQSLTTATVFFSSNLLFSKKDQQKIDDPISQMNNILNQYNEFNHLGQVFVLIIKLFDPLFNKAIKLLTQTSVIPLQCYQVQKQIQQFDSLHNYQLEYSIQKIFSQPQYELLSIVDKCPKFITQIIYRLIIVANLLRRNKVQKSQANFYVFQNPNQSEKMFKVESLQKISNQNQRNTRFSKDAPSSKQIIHLRKKWVCQCNFYKQTGIPCEHEILATLYNKDSLFNEINQLWKQQKSQ